MAAALAVAGAVGCSSGEAPRGAPRKAAWTPPRRSIDRAFDAIYRRYGRQLLGICMGAIDERSRSVKCYGRVERGSSQRPTPRTLFQIGSISKTFTATLLALRVQAGAVRLEDPLRRYIPPADGSAQVPGSLTLLDLATHYSGLPRSTPVENSLGVTSADQYLAAAGRCEVTPGCPAGPPGRRYVYSNFAFGVLGEALGRHDGYRTSSYSAWEKDNYVNVTSPLGMSDTRSAYGWKAFSPGVFDAVRARATIGYPPREADPPFFPPPPYADAAAGLYSSSPDMIAWLSYNMGLGGTSPLKAARRLLYDTPRLTRSRVDPPNQRKRIGLAWRIDINGSGRAATTCISKSGESRGFSAHMVFVKHARRGAFVMLNNRPEGATSATIATDLVNSLPSAPGSSRSTRTCTTSPD